jgi:hydroxymethylbilane synthase
VLLRIATRRSALALAQAQWVGDRLRAMEPALQVELVPVVTAGDRMLNRSLIEIGGKGVFVRELEEALREGRADAAVHSLKDLPAEAAPGLTLAAFPERDDARDALVLPRGAEQRPESRLSLPPGARIGNSSLRRKAQLLFLRPDFRVDAIRGNVDTRLRKLDAGEFDGLVLAAAGLRRLGLGDRISHAFDPEEFVPAPGQGALAVQCVVDTKWRPLLARLDCAETRACVETEREVMARLGGGCMAPLGAHARASGEQLTLAGMVARPDGTQRVFLRLQGRLADGAGLAQQLAERILASGGAEILAEIRAAA